MTMTTAAAIPPTATVPLATALTTSLTMPLGLLGIVSAIGWMLAGLLLLAGIILILWGLVEVSHDHTQTLQHHQQREQLRIHHDTQRLTRHLHHEAHRVQAAMLHTAMQHIHHPPQQPQPSRQQGDHHG